LIRSVLWATAIGLLMSGLPANADEAAPTNGAAKPEAVASPAPPPEAAAPAAAPAANGHKKSSKKSSRRSAKKGGGGGKHGGGRTVTPDQANSPFADVPKDHWAYEAVAKAVESGLLQGYSNKFYGSRAMTRYQMAVVVARMLDRLHVLKANGRMFTAQDIANLEALTIEFADELSLLNVKVSTLEEQVAVLRKDVDLLKYELGPGGPRSPITGVIAGRSVFTSSGRPGYGQVGLTTAPGSAATVPAFRYRGDNSGPGRAMGITPPGLIANPFDFDSREFGTVSQLSINLDRQVARDIEFHMQIDFDAETGDATRGDATIAAFTPGVGAGNAGILGNARTPIRQVIGAGGSPNSPLIFGSGRGQSFFGSPVHVNQAYIQFNSWLGDADAVTGVYPTPFNVENNGPSRTYQWTITPSVANTFWESLRPTGAELRNGRKEDYWLWNVGVFSNLDGQNYVNPITGQPGLSSGATLMSGVQVATAAGPIDPFGNGSAVLPGRMPTPRLAVMSDAPRGIDGDLETDDIGFYLRLGGQNRDNLGFGWQVGYIDNGGDIRPGGGFPGSPSDWYAWQGEVDYKWKKWMVLGQYYSGRTRNLSEAELTTGSAAFDARNTGRGTPFPNIFAEDTESDSLMALVTYAWDRQSSITLRFEDADDETGPAKIGGTFYTFAFNRRMGERGLFQFEYVTADTQARTDRGILNNVDISDDITQMNYRLHF
jgi:hypothetical protein